MRTPISKRSSQKDANAYKTRAQGTAELVKAWMPLMLLVTVLGALALALYFKVDTNQLVPVTPIISALLKK